MIKKVLILPITIVMLCMVTGCIKGNHKTENTLNNTIPVEKTDIESPDIGPGCTIKRTMKEVRGSSMEPMIKSGENLTLLEGYYDCNEVKRGDVVAYSYSGNEYPLIKRVLAMPEDSLVFNNSNLYVNNEVMKNSQGKNYVFSEIQRRMISLYINEGRLVEGAYLIFGEDIYDSTDSRRFGAVGKEAIIGKFVINEIEFSKD